MVEDLCFYTSHRFMHTKLMYPNIHKMHHTYINTVSIAVEYTHPIEYFFGNIVPGFIPAIILGKNIHFYTFLVWGLYRLGESIDGHCGYEFTWSPYRMIPFSVAA